MRKQEPYNVSFIHREYSRLRHDEPEVLFAYECLSIEDQQNLDAQVMRLRERLTSGERCSLGPSNLLSLLYRLGRFMNTNGYRP